FLVGRVLELLAAHGCPSDQASLGDRKHGHAPVIAAGRLRILLAAARTRFRSSRSGFRGCGCRDRYGFDAGPEFEIAGAEFIERTLFLKEVDHPVPLPTSRHADADLGHGRFADALALFVDTAIAMRAADAESRLADGREHSVGMGVGKEMTALPGILEQ